MSTKKKYEELAERSIRSEEKLLSAIEQSNEFHKTLVITLQNINQSVIKNNDGLHKNLELSKNIQKILTDYLKKVIMYTAAILTVIAGLNLGGII